MNSDTRLAVIVPTIGRPELAECLNALASQLEAGDRVLVVCDVPERYDYVQRLVAILRGDWETKWRCYLTGGWGHYGHLARNWALGLLGTLQHAPRWVCTIDDDDKYLPGALAAMREAIRSGAAKWYVFQMIGGPGSHFAGKTVPTMGHSVRLGNIGTPMMLWPVRARARFGTDDPELDGLRGPGYFGDAHMALALRAELGEPLWVPVCTTEIRPSRVAA